MDFWVCLDKQERRRYELTGQRMKRAEDESTDLDCSMQMSDGYNDYWSSPDTGYWSSPVVSAAVPASSMNNVVVGGRNLNSKLYALRSVVPNITKMDKISILKDAIEYIQKLREQERRMLAEISLLESAPEVHGHGDLLTSTVQPVVPNAGHAMPPVKKTRSPMSLPSAVTPASAMAAASPPVEAIEVRVTGAGDKLLVVSVAWRHRKGAMGKVCCALEGLRLAVFSANIMVASGTVTYTALVQRQEIHKSEMKELIETAIAQVDVAGSTLSTMSYY
ncbi:transcription factor BHLH6-like [Hordeum vulgare subsp. vulgare]|nr:transcription factor BHLH6-like [Hordeum vulgare subsp. vulgare]